MRAALYARYSDDRQNDRSIADQFEVCRRHAALRGWQVVAEFSDAAISGAAMANRPGLIGLLAAAATGSFDLVLVEDTDRLARNREHDAHVFNRLAHAGVTIATLATDKVTVIESALRGLMMNELFLSNLAQKTSRGMRSNAEEGLATGSRLYGYRSQPGGQTTIVAAEAEVIRRVFAGYAGGQTARQIAAALNAEGVASPHGGRWNASTINGNPARGYGILRAELYAGVKVWNRLVMAKDPDTGRRTHRIKPAEEWRRTPVEHLRIVSAEAWNAVQARKAREAHAPALAIARSHRPGLLAGLLKCGLCGASYTSSSGGRLICAARREGGDAACSNRRTLARAEVEARVLEGLQTRLLAPDAVAEYVRAYHAAWQEAAAERRDRRQPLEKRIAELKRRCGRIVDATADGRASRTEREKMFEFEDEIDRLETQLAAWKAEEAASTVTLHPSAASRYGALVATLQAYLAAAADQPADPPARAEVEAVRALVIQVRITPRSNEPRAEVDLAIVGDLARFMDEVPDAQCMRKVVAGGRYRSAHTSPIVIELPLREAA